MYKIALANKKGGVGKSTSAICIAQELIRRGYRVLFIDADQQCNSTAFYQAEKEGVNTFIDILTKDIPARDCIQKTENGDIIASSPISDSDLESMVSVNERRFTHLKRSLRGIDSDYDFIIMDTHPSVAVGLKNVLAVADYIIVPYDGGAWSLDGYVEFTDAVEMARDNNENLKVMGLLACKAHKTNLSRRLLKISEQIAEYLEAENFHTSIRESVKCAEAITEMCIPLYKYDPKGNTCRDYENLVDEILERL